MALLACGRQASASEGAPAWAAWGAELARGPEAGLEADITETGRKNSSHSFCSGCYHLRACLTFCRANLRGVRPSRLGSGLDQSVGGRTGSTPRDIRRPSPWQGEEPAADPSGRQRRAFRAGDPGVMSPTAGQAEDQGRPNAGSARTAHCRSPGCAGCGAEDRGVAGRCSAAVAAAARRCRCRPWRRQGRGESQWLRSSGGRCDPWAGGGKPGACL
jgi:hypothetical protein